MLDTIVVGDFCIAALNSEMPKALVVRFGDRSECSSTIVMTAPGGQQLREAEPGAAEILADRAIAETLRLRGLLRRVPDLRY